MNDWRTFAQTAAADLQAALTGRENEALEHMENAESNLNNALMKFDEMMEEGLEETPEEFKETPPPGAPKTQVTVRLDQLLMNEAYARMKAKGGPMNGYRITSIIERGIYLALQERE